ncbi:SRPBCC family protein [Glycocaulis profundi]|nr:SRPBCC family protein [Glycocaulis profundi]
MSLDFASALGAVTRSVTDTERDGAPAKVVTLARAYDTSAEDLWDAATNPERLPRWFAPVTGDFRPGGKYQIKGNASGTITACEPPRRLDLTWEFGGGVSWVELRLSPEAAGRTRLSLSHICPVDEFWSQYGPGAGGVGWDLAMLGLSLHASDPDWERFDEEAFATSPEGIAFITGAGRDWGRAAAASGEDPGQAKAAADRTIAFYTGQQA